MSCCGKKGPGYSSPKDAHLHGPKEDVLFVTCVRPKKDLADYLAIVDVNPQSKNFSQVIGRTFMPNIGDELHHSVCKDNLIKQL